MCLDATPSSSSGCADSFSHLASISTPLRLYHGVHTNVDDEVDHLPVPHTTKNFLISPPGSPPEGWEPVEEEPPNATALAADLLAALQRLQLNRARPTDRPGVQLIMAPEDDEDELMESPSDSHADTVVVPAPSKAGLTVYLEDHDFKEEADEDGSGALTPTEEGLWEGEKMHGGISSVKATVASMRQDGFASPRAALSPAGGKIARVPTPRPPTEAE